MKNQNIVFVAITFALAFALAPVTKAAPGPVQLPPPAPGPNAVNVSNSALVPPQSTIITFDVPGAGTGPGQGTMPYAINPAGAIMGPYLDASNVYYGFVRDPNGVITTFNVPGGGTGPYQGTQPISINPAGTIAGTYQDAGGTYHGNGESLMLDARFLLSIKFAPMTKHPPSPKATAGRANDQ